MMESIEINYLFRLFLLSVIIYESSAEHQPKADKTIATDSQIMYYGPIDEW